MYTAVATQIQPFEIRLNSCSRLSAQLHKYESRKEPWFSMCDTEINSLNGLWWPGEKVLFL
jgi:hypothetical protein